MPGRGQDHVEANRIYYGSMPYNSHKTRLTHPTHDIRTPSVMELHLVELAADVVPRVFLLGLIENLLGVAVFDQVTRTPALCGVNIQETGLVSHPLGLLEIVGDDGDGLALL